MAAYMIDIKIALRQNIFRKNLHQTTGTLSIDELENLHADRTTNYMFWAITEAEGEVGIP